MFQDVEKNSNKLQIYSFSANTRAIPLTTERASLVLSSNYFFKNKCVICLLSEVLKLNFICEHKWELKLLTVPLGYPQSSGMCISHAICDLCMMVPKHLLFFCMSLRDDHWNLRWKRFLHF